MTDDGGTVLDLRGELPPSRRLTAAEGADLEEELVANRAHFAPFFMWSEQQVWVEVYLRGLLTADAPRRNDVLRCVHGRWRCACWGRDWGRKRAGGRCNSSGVRGVERCLPGGTPAGGEYPCSGCRHGGTRTASCSATAATYPRKGAARQVRRGNDATRRRPQGGRVEALPTLLAAQWRRYRFLNGNKGSLAAEFAAVRAVAVRDELPGPEAWLHAQEAPSRQLPAPGETPEVRYYLSQAPVDTPLATLVRVSGMRLISAGVFFAAAVALFAFVIPLATTVTKNWFVVFTSSVFAALGFRGLFFLVGGVMVRAISSKAGIAVLLTLWALELLAATVVPVAAVSLAMLFDATIVILLASVRARPRDADADLLLQP